MKLIHLSDLHLGKRVNEISMLDDQKYILTQILDMVDEEQPQAVLISGDVYDKSVPNTEAVELLDEFLCQLSKRHVVTFVISGNHDSPERIAFGGRLMEEAGIYISRVYHGKTEAVTLQDDYGEVHFYLLPFVKPAHVRRFFPEEQIESYTQALKVAVDAMQVDCNARNILLTHQFVTGASRCDSEEISVGGSDHVDAEVFRAFDYVALGHIHGPQNIIPNKIRYCGTPLKYSFSEADHKKSVTVVELQEKGNLQIGTLALRPLHDMREVRGEFASVMQMAATQDYVHIILTDEEEIPEAVGRLRTQYPNIMKLTYDNTRTRYDSVLTQVVDVKRKTPLELFRELYQMQNNQPMHEKQEKYLQDLIERILEESK